MGIGGAYPMIDPNSLSLSLSCEFLEEVKMKLKRILVLSCGFLLIIVSSVIVKSGGFAGFNSQHSSHTPILTDGSANPQFIPDVVAYEILFRLLSQSDPTDPDGKAQRGYTRAYGFSDGESAALLNAAQEYKRRIAGSDARVDGIKNAHWPRPSAEVMQQLRSLQAQKEGIILDVAGILKHQLQNYYPAKLSNQINLIKSKTKGFALGLPSKKIGFNFISDYFTVAAQAPGCDSQVYIYSDIYVDWTQLIIFGNGSYSVPYNNCGHTISLNTTIWGPGCGYYSSSCYLEQGSTLFDGSYSSNTDAESYCPVVNETYYAGSNASVTTVDPWLRLISASSSPDKITFGAGNSEFTVSYAASTNASGHTFSITPGVQIIPNSGALQIGDIVSDPVGSSTVTVGSGSFIIRYSVNTSKNAGEFKPSVEAVSGGAKVRPDPAFIQSSNNVKANIP